MKVAASPRVYMGDARKWHLVTSHQSPVTSHQSPVTSHQSLFTGVLSGSPERFLAISVGTRR